MNVHFFGPIYKWELFTATFFLVDIFTEIIHPKQQKRISEIRKTMNRVMVTEAPYPNSQQRLKLLVVVGVFVSLVVGLVVVVIDVIVLWVVVVVGLIVVFVVCVIVVVVDVFGLVVVVIGLVVVDVVVVDVVVVDIVVDVVVVDIVVVDFVVDIVGVVVDVVVVDVVGVDVVDVIVVVDVVGVNVVDVNDSRSMESSLSPSESWGTGWPQTPNIKRPKIMTIFIFVCLNYLTKNLWISKERLIYFKTRRLTRQDR